MKEDINDDAIMDDDKGKTCRIEGEKS